MSFQKAAYCAPEGLSPLTAPSAVTWGDSRLPSLTKIAEQLISKSIYELKMSEAKIINKKDYQPLVRQKKLYIFTNYHNYNHHPAKVHYWT